MKTTQNLVKEIISNVILDEEQCPIMRTKFFLMLLASCANSTTLDKLNVEEATDKGYYAMYRKSWDEDYLYEDVLYIDNGNKAEDLPFIYILYSEDEYSEEKDEYTKVDPKFCWRIHKDDAWKVLKTMEWLDFFDPYESLYESFLKYKSSCGLNDFYEYL